MSSKQVKPGLLDRAIDVALSCRRCRTLTDTQFDKESKTWTTYCECGDISKYSNSEVISEAKQIIKTLPKRK